MADPIDHEVMGRRRLAGHEQRVRVIAERETKEAAEAHARDRLVGVAWARKVRAAFESGGFQTPEDAERYLSEHQAGRWDGPIPRGEYLG